MRRCLLDFSHLLKLYLIENQAAFLLYKAIGLVHFLTDTCKALILCMKLCRRARRGWGGLLDNGEELLIW